MPTDVNRRVAAEVNRVSVEFDQRMTRLARSMMNALRPARRAAVHSATALSRRMAELSRQARKGRTNAH